MLDTVKKRFAQTCLLAVVLSLLIAGVVRADVGPKPSVVVDFPDASGETFYATLLSSYGSTGPYSRISYPEDAAQIEEEYGDDPDMLEACIAFASYEDESGYYFLNFIEDCTESKRLSWTYYPPDEFKILVYYPDEGTFVHSEAMTNYAFDSYYTVTGVEGGLLRVRQSYNFWPELLSLAARIVLTILIELLLALLFRFRGKGVLRLILIVNLFTQIGLNVALNAIAYYSGGLAFIFLFIPLEMIVFAIEAVIYARRLPKRSDGGIRGRTAVAYALLANLSSLVLGWVLALYLPGIF